MEARYGGWSNSPTQKAAQLFALHDDHWVDTARACWKPDDERYAEPSYDAIDKLSRYMKQISLATLPSDLKPMAQLLLNDAFEKVNWDEISKSYLEVVGEEVEDRLTKEAMAKYYPEWKYEQERKKQEDLGVNY